MLAIPRRLRATTLRWREEPGDLSRAGRWGARPDAPTCGPGLGVFAAKRARAEPQPYRRRRGEGARARRWREPP